MIAATRIMERSLNMECWPQQADSTTYKMRRPAGRLTSHVRARQLLFEQEIKFPKTVKHKQQADQRPERWPQPHRNLGPEFLRHQRAGSIPIGRNQTKRALGITPRLWQGRQAGQAFPDVCVQPPPRRSCTAQIADVGVAQKVQIQHGDAAR